jgi:hypothetical protein
MAHPPNIPLVPSTNEQNFPRHDPRATWGRSGHAWPKVLNREFLPEDVEPWRRANAKYDQRAVPPEFFEARCPRPRKVLVSGKVLPGERVPIKVVQELVDAGYADTVGDDLICKDPKVYSELVAYLASLGIAVADVDSSIEAPASLASLVQAAPLPSERDQTDIELERKRKQNDALEVELARTVALNSKLKALREERAALKAETPVKKKGGWPKGVKRPKKSPEPEIQSLDQFSKGEPAA